MSVIVNGAFRGQVVTGQQRYASELAARLPWRELAPSSRAQRHPVSAWLWSQSVSARLRRDDLLVTLTSRGPIWSSRQILVVHDLFVLDHPEWYSRKYGWTHAPILRAQLRSARGIVAVSEPTAERVRELVGPGTPIRIVPNAAADVFRSVPDGAPGAVSERFGLVPGTFLLAVASTDPRKNLRTIIQAYRSLPEEWRLGHPLVLVGGQAAHVFAGTDPVREAPDIRQLGYVDDVTLAALYAAAGRVLLLSLDEGFGLPAVEALAAGGRLLASDIPALRWACGGDALYAPPRDAAAMARAMHDLDAEPISDLSSRRFSWEASAEALHEFATSLCG